VDLLPLTPKQAATIRLAPESRIAVWEGAVRSSKTIVSLLAWSDHILHAPPGPLLMAGRTTDTLRRNAIDPLTDLLGAKHVRVTWGSGIATILGRTVHLVGADNAAAETRIRGLTLAGAYVDELSILPEQWWHMLLSRLSVRGARVLATTNPGSPRHWLLTDYLTRASLTITPDGRVERDPDAPTAAGIHRYRFLLADNAALPPEYVQSLEALYTGLFYRRFVEGEWVAAEGAVYPSLDPAGVHGGHLCRGCGQPVLLTGHTCPKKPAAPRLTNWTVGIDHGMSNPTHAVLVGIDSEGVGWVMSECVLTDQASTVSEQTARLGAWMDTQPIPTGQTVNIIVDPAAKALRTEWKRQRGAYPWQADNSVLPGVQTVGALLDRGRLRFVNDAVPVLLRELSGYVWDARAQERGEDKPLKQDDHGADALRYAVMALKTHWR
jgi:hypothetical protein